VLSLVLVEVVLQAAAFGMRLSGREAETRWATQRRRVVTLGDSNTYGVMVEREQAYPRVLERLWNDEQPVPLEVLNLGYPGTNSSHVRKQLGRVLVELQPDLIIVMVGANDLWTAPVPLSDADDERSLLRRLLEERSRTYKLWYMLVRAFGGGGVDVSTVGQDEEGAAAEIRVGSTSFEVGWERGEARRGWPADLRANLLAIEASCERAGVDLVFMAYQTSMDFYGRANPVIRETVRETGGRLIDLQPVFDRKCRGAGCKNLLLWDGHPNAAGYDLLARTVLRELTSAD